MNSIEDQNRAREDLDKARVWFFRITAGFAAVLFLIWQASPKVNVRQSLYAELSMADSYVTRQQRPSYRLKHDLRSAAVAQALVDELEQAMYPTIAGLTEDLRRWGLSIQFDHPALATQRLTRLNGVPQQVSYRKLEQFLADIQSGWSIEVAKPAFRVDPSQLTEWFQASMDLARKSVNRFSPPPLAFRQINIQSVSFVVGKSGRPRVLLSLYDARLRAKYPDRKVPLLVLRADYEWQAVTPAFVSEWVTTRFANVLESQAQLGR